MNDRAKLVEALRDAECDRAWQDSRPRTCRQASPSSPRKWCYSCLALAAADLIEGTRETDHVVDAAFEVFEDWPEDEWAFTGKADSLKRLYDALPWSAALSPHRTVE